MLISVIFIEIEHFEVYQILSQFDSILGTGRGLTGIGLYSTENCARTENGMKQRLYANSLTLPPILD